MEILIGLIIIAIGAFCQSSCYVPINKIKEWSWESYWLVQGVFAWIAFPLLGALLAVPAGHSLMEVYAADPVAAMWTIFFGILWGIGGLTFGLSMAWPSARAYRSERAPDLVQYLRQYSQAIRKTLPCLSSSAWWLRCLASALSA